MIQLLVDNPHSQNADLSSLGRLIYAGSPISEALLASVRRLLPTTEFVQLYGMTELSPVATILLPSDHADPQRRRSAGRQPLTHRSALSTATTRMWLPVRLAR